jgi:hypothetical protein
VKGIKMNGKIIAATSIGLVIGLVLGILISIVFNLPTVTNTNGAGISNQVQVSGMVRDTQTGTIYFLQLAKLHNDDMIHSSSPIVDGKYSVVLVGNQSYDIFVDRYPYYSTEKPDYAVYVPSGVTTFTADF